MEILENLSRLHEALFNPDRIPVAILAIVLTMVIGMVTGPRGFNANPLIWLIIDKVIGQAGDRLDRLHRPKADLMFRGFLVSAVAVFLVLALGKVFEALVHERGLQGLTEAGLLCLVLTSGTVWFALLRLYFAEEKDNLDGAAYRAVAVSARTNLAGSDRYEITRTALGYAARSFDKGMVAPVFWFLIGGLPVALIYTTLAALAWRFGKDGFTKGFGTVPLALEKLMGYIPGLFAAFLLTFAGAFTPTAKLGKGLLAWFGHKNRAVYEQGGYPLTALAWSLNVSLGGAYQDISGSAIQGVWVGPKTATAQNDHKHLWRALFISFVAHILLIAVLCSAYIWSGRLFGA